MSICSFLSIDDECVECFNNCPFYEWTENDGECPFKHCSKVRNIEMNSFTDYNLFKEDKNSPFSILYK